MDMVLKIEIGNVTKIIPWAELPSGDKCHFKFYEEELGLNTRVADSGFAPNSQDIVSSSSSNSSALPSAPVSSISSLTSNFSSLFPSKPIVEEKKVAEPMKNKVEDLLSQLFLVSCTLLPLNDTRQLIQFSSEQSPKEIGKFAKTLHQLGIKIKMESQSQPENIIKSLAKLEIQHTLVEISKKLDTVVELNKKLNSGELNQLLAPL